jgi:hypothetical protein
LAVTRRSRELCRRDDESLFSPLHRLWSVVTFLSGIRRGLRNTQ